MRIVQEETKPTLRLPGQIFFERNQKLMLHLNRKYDKYNFYTMHGPVGLTVDGDPIEAMLVKCRTQAKLKPLDGFDIDYDCDIFEDIVEPIIEELLKIVEEGSDIYLYLIGPTGAVNPEEPAMTFMLRGHWPH